MTFLSLLTQNNEHDIHVKEAEAQKFNYFLSVWHREDLILHVLNKNLQYLSQKGGNEKKLN